MIAIYLMVLSLAMSWLAIVKNDSNYIVCATIYTTGMFIILAIQDRHK